MRKYILLLIIISTLYTVAGAQSEGIERNARAAATGETAYEITAYAEQFWRLAGNPGFDSTILRVKEKLEKAGYVPEADGPAPLTYRIEERPLDKPAWYPVDAWLKLEGENMPLLAFRTNRNMVAVNSHPTPSGGVTAEIIKINDLEELPGKDVRGKIVYAEMHPYYLYRAAVGEFGAAGILTYEMPEYLRPAVNRQSIQFRSIPYNDTIASWSVALSYAARESLNQFLNNGGKEATVFIDTWFTEAPELTLVAQVHGTQLPQEEVVISAHVQEPGANDNASGVGAATEIAEILARWNPEIAPDRTITFLWGDEITSTRRYVEEHGDQIKWGFSLDMVGENTAVTGGSFLIEKMPDPSAVWTRGEDKHSEWGGRPISKEELQPHYLNDFVMKRFKSLGESREWNVQSNPYEGGSDHVPFLRGNIPAVLFWHFTDQFYHTDQDRIDKVSVETLRNVVAGTLSVVMTLANGHEDLALDILNEIVFAAEERLAEEARLSQKALSEGEARKEQEDILRTWTDYYVAVAGTVTDLASGPELDAAVNAARGKIRDAGKKALASLR